MLRNKRRKRTRAEQKIRNERVRQATAAEEHGPLNLAMTKKFKAAVEARDPIAVRGAIEETSAE